MLEDLPWPAPAKLNLFLQVTGRRPDGYHNIQTLFQILDWGDELTFSVVNDGRIRRTRGIPGVAEQLDLTLVAAKLLKKASGVKFGTDICVSKKIPQGAGLGGASTDAATTLVALNQLWGCGLSEDELADLGLELGADVPLFVRGASAWASGVGERLTPQILGERHYVLVMPDVGVSTAEIFASPALPRQSMPVPVGQLSAIDEVGNDCQQVVMAQYPELRLVLRELEVFGAARMTGTGSSFFIQMAEKYDAERVTNELKSRYNVRAVTGRDDSKLRTRLKEYQLGRRQVG